MTPTLWHKVLVVAGLVLVGVGGADAAVAGEPDLVVVFVLLGVVLVALLAALQAHRPGVPLRADLVAWLRARSAATGEPLEHVADRALAAQRAALEGRPPGEREGP